MEEYVKRIPSTGGAPGTQRRMQEEEKKVFKNKRKDSSHNRKDSYVNFLNVTLCLVVEMLARVLPNPAMLTPTYGPPRGSGTGAGNNARC